jgi:predicted Zn-dependent protease
MKRRLMFRHFIPAAAAIVLYTSALAQTAQPDAHAIEKEILVGKTLAREMERHEKILSDSTVSAYVAHLAENLAPHAGMQTQLESRVLDSSEVRAVAFPGGSLYVTSGLIARTETEAELAGVLAHLMAHLSLRHAVRQQSGTSLMFIGSWNGSCTRFAGDTQVPMSSLSSLRDLETEADNAGIRYLRAAGYDPLAMIEFFNKLRYDKPRLAQTWTADDLLALRSYVEDSMPPDPQYIVNTGAFDRIRERVTPAPKAPVSLERAILTRRSR